MTSPSGRHRRAAAGPRAKLVVVAAGVAAAVAGIVLLDVATRPADRSVHRAAAPPASRSPAAAPPASRSPAAAPASASPTRATAPPPGVTSSPGTRPVGRPSPAGRPATPAPPSPAAASPAASAAGSPAPASSDQAAPLAAVTVLNDSRIARLARRAAADVREAGWPVAEVGNLPARVPHSTVYYDAGLRAQAQRLAGAIGVTRVEPRPGRWRARGLVLVVTRDYSRGS